MTEPTIDDLLEAELHHALQYLYDPTELRKNGLLALLGVDAGPSPLTHVRRALGDAIESLKPDSHVPADAHAWRIYNILTYRYVEQLSQKETAADLALSVRQLRRDEHAAIRVLVHTLKHRYKLTAGSDEAQAIAQRAGETDRVQSARENELAWLQQTFPSETVDIQVLLTSVLRTAAPLIQASGVTIDLEVPPSVPAVRGRLATVRQALLNVLSAAVPAVSGGRGLIRIQTLGAETSLNLCFWREDGSLLPVDDQMLENVAVSRELIELGGGTITPTSQNSGCSVTVTLPNAVTLQIPVLIIDDNADTLQLFHRYLATTHFSPTSISDPSQALVTATQLRPGAIVLDVMLPGIDGWELLGRLRQHPQTQDIPIAVCTILPQEKLALALGAAAFLQKPFTRESLISLLATLTTPANGPPQA